MKKSSYSLLLIGLFMLIPAFIFAQETGKASYYNDKFQGKNTASGEPYDKDKFTAAHRTLPFGAIVRVTNLKNQKAVTVRINDMGPHNLSRVIDLSGAAADAISMKLDGVVDVQLDVISEYPDENTSKIPLGATSSGGTVTPPGSPAASASNSPSTSHRQAAPTVVINETQSPVDQPSSNPLSLPNIKPGPAPTGLSQAPSTVVVAGGSSPLSTNASQRVMRSEKGTTVAADTKGSGLFKFIAYRTTAEGYGVQIGVYADYRTILEQTNQLMLADIQDIMVYAYQDKGKDVFKMIVGPFASRGAAEVYKQKLKTIGKDSFIIVLKDLN